MSGKQADFFNARGTMGKYINSRNKTGAGTIIFSLDCRQNHEIILNGMPGVKRALNHVLPKNRVGSKSSENSFYVPATKHGRPLNL